ncbi:DUF1517 domain-containing protein [Anabaena cylindrica FACHB-243]|uniref:DUF1517 domain-containing protein n=1 Tax=Anabaena cylindrica (strain ATCC 27899 / PCC 7122) TaxID=272123 RepID=K9ZLK7_ANACC|nr:MULTISPECIES: DUF1517 domain-containing protein [Anabaena]AFZ60138.1 hypothetical protein Anacy_4793 [Anabaena cylindrica PCC 7122]MBD2417807.1 DUF1517 domain-containing protein [Anabaena cylindrica FACHB-243]MBY5285291.1 DUF1517 domain-containing protein [Anabaena sp. CCAP 1446/1C]MBY5308000.1 DUF1517 domain-containing protein [Anabaena sp. CCAP 1446/1C]MCM2404722.1 DUF1517 domain-containing protein [Anabaena sp. CCAP 1446/1C]
MRDRLNRMMGKTRYVVCRLFLHLSGGEVAPVLGVLNRAARQAMDAEGDLEVLGEELVAICQNLLQYDDYWTSAANEGDVFWSEGEAGDYVNELFTDSAQRYLSEPDFSSASGFDEPLSIPVTRNVVVMLTVAYEGEVPQLETDLSNIQALKEGFKALINLHYKHNLQAIQVHFSPAQLGDELTNDQLLQYFPELIPL